MASVPSAFHNGREPQSDRAQARRLMQAFAERTGLTSDVVPKRYLWTDAFAVCNFLALDEIDLAEALIEQVHVVLGRHRADDARRGWISGLDEETGAAHPTRGGLRIGKAMPERDPDEEVYDQDLEWERDGQYFHYLTRWMHALDQFARRTGQAETGRWARELAQAAHGAFTYAPTPGAPKRMVWKASIDLSRPLISAMGQHDALDGVITYLQLRAHRTSETDGPDLDAELHDMAMIVAGTNLLTDDPLGIGGLLADAYRLAQLLRDRPGDNGLLGLVLGAASSGLNVYLRRRPFARPVEQRLAFRELGLAIGLQAVSRMWRLLERESGDVAIQPALRNSLDALIAQVPVARSLTGYWCDPARQAADSWRAHEDINAVMLATALVPSGYLDL
jgi:hypothetical protein